MHIFDVLGPVMIGPSSSHTAGAVKIGYVTRKLLGEAPVQANILLHGSFADTGSGHGTDRAVVAGLLGCKPDDPQIPSSFEAAKKAGFSFQITRGTLRGAHPNTVKIEVVGEHGSQLEVRRRPHSHLRDRRDPDRLFRRIQHHYRTQHRYPRTRGTGDHSSGTEKREYRRHAAVPQHQGRLCGNDSGV